MKAKRFAFLWTTFTKGPQPHIYQPQVCITPLTQVVQGERGRRPVLPGERVRAGGGPPLARGNLRQAGAGPPLPAHRANTLLEIPSLNGYLGSIRAHSLVGGLFTW